MLQAIIVDDEEFGRSSLFFLLQEHCPEIRITGIAKSVAEAKTLFEEQVVDAVFLDIAMPKENGFALLPTIQEYNASVIFTTAYDQYAIKAIKASAVDYLLKPIDIEELKASVKKLIEVRNLYSNKSQGDTGLSESLSNLMDTLNDNNAIKKISIAHTQGFKLIDIDDIVQVEADSNYSIFHLKGGERTISSKSLKEYEDILPEDKFMRVHKSNIINLSYLKDYSNKNGATVTLTNGDIVSISRRRSSDFFEKVKSIIPQ